ncbi:MAG: histidine phosphatase family protein [Anaerolineales bacterium]
MSKLILVRHAAPATDPCVAPNQWPLSEAGRQSCGALASALAPFLPASLLCSREAKAVETAALVGRKLGVGYKSVSGLQEHIRTSEDWLGEAEFQTGVASVFARPAEVVFGDESADQARARFTSALEALLAEHRDDNLVVVTHGTVMTLFIQQTNPAIVPGEFWKKLGLPAVAVLDRPALALERLIERVGVDGN